MYRKWQIKWRNLYLQKKNKFGQGFGGIDDARAS
jgi:hypothetical protein